MQTSVDKETFDAERARSFGMRTTEPYSPSDTQDLARETTGFAIPGETIITGKILITASAQGESPQAQSLGYRGDEVGVEGGVALTEEAVRTHTPDLEALNEPF